MKSQLTSCLICGKHGEALVCSSQSCPIVVHESCMSCAAHFDDTGCFYCPYCFLKLSLIECDQAREKALLARRSLVSFLGMGSRNDAGYLNSSHSLKRKKPELPMIVKKSNDASCNRVHQRVQLENHNDNLFLEKLFGHKRQAGPTNDYCLGKGSVRKDDGDLTRSCHLSIKNLEGYKTGWQEKVQTVPGFGIENIRSGDCGIAYENKLINYVPCTREGSAFVSQTSTGSTFGNVENAKKVENSYGVEREQTQTDPRDTPCLANPLQMHEKSCKENGFQDDHFVRTQVVKNLDTPTENGEDCIGRTDEGSRKAKNGDDCRRNDNKSLPCGEPAHLCVKYSDTEQTVANCSDSVAEKAQTHEGPQETSVFCVREVNASAICENSDGMKDVAPQNDYSVVREVIDNSVNVKHCSQVVEDLSQRIDNRQTIFKLPIQDAYPTRADNESEEHEKSRNSINNNDEISKPMDQYCNGHAEKEQTHKEFHENYAYSAMENTTAISEHLEEAKDSESQEKFLPRSQRVEISGNADRPADVGSNYNGNADVITTQGIALEDPVHPRREYNVITTHKSGNLTRKQPETTKRLERYRNGVAEIEQSQAELQSTMGVDKQEMAEEFGTESSLSFQDECFLQCEKRVRKDVAQNASVGENDFEGISEGQRWVKIVKNHNQVTKSKSASMLPEDFGCIDDESCNTEYRDLRIHAGTKRQMKKKVKDGLEHEVSSGCSENEIEEYELSTHGKERSFKKILYAASGQLLCLLRDVGNFHGQYKK